MLYDYQKEELREQSQRAEHALKSSCPLLEDEVAVAAWNHIQELEAFVNYIASDYFELSHEKVRVQRDDYVRMAKELREKFCVEVES